MDTKQKNWIGNSDKLERGFYLYMLKYILKDDELGEDVVYIHNEK